MKNFLLNFMQYIAATGTFEDFQDIIQELYAQMLGPIIGIIVGAAALLGIWMGVQFWQASGDEGKLKKAKDNVKYFVIGIIIIFVVAAGLPLLIGALSTWAGVN